MVAYVVHLPRVLALLPAPHEKETSRRGVGAAPKSEDQAHALAYAPGQTLRSTDPARDRGSRARNKEPQVPDAGGASLGAPKGNKNALKHGYYTSEAIARRQAIAVLIRYGRRLSGWCQRRCGGRRRRHRAVPRGQAASITRSSPRGHRIAPSAGAAESPASGGPMAARRQTTLQYCKCEGRAQCRLLILTQAGPNPGLNARPLLRRFPGRSGHLSGPLKSTLLNHQVTDRTSSNARQ